MSSSGSTFRTLFCDAEAWHGAGPAAEAMPAFRHPALPESRDADRLRSTHLVYLRAERILAEYGSELAQEAGNHLDAALREIDSAVGVGDLKLAEQRSEALELLLELFQPGSTTPPSVHSGNRGR